MDRKTVVMGRYPQNCGSEKEPIEWLVLKEEENRCLCINKYLLDNRQYHNVSEKVIWRNCALRHWLNNEFFTTAFSSEERERIILSDVVNQAQNTQDHIFLLNADETEEFFAFEERGAETTEYARQRGAWFVREDCTNKNKGSWWLRYYGDSDYSNDIQEGEYDCISCVNFDGYIEIGAEDVTGKSCVRPVFWLKKR